MKIVEINFTPWDKTYTFDLKDHEVGKKDKVIVKTEYGIESGVVRRVKELSDEEVEKFIKDKGFIKPILRKANLSDLEKIKEREEHKKEYLEVCKGFIKKYNLPIKLVDLHFSFDGGKITFAFIAKGRIDFRDLVKDLTHYFQKSIRLQQVNVREEVKSFGSIGPCGKELCCVRFHRDLGNVTLDKARNQQVIHWGTERLSGVCGRLKCCLSFEEEVYKELAQKLPALGSTIKTERGKGEVVSWHILKQTVSVRIDEDTVIEVPIKN